jgi:hypothetical protein
MLIPAGEAATAGMGFSRAVVGAAVTTTFRPAHIAAAQLQTRADSRTSVMVARPRGKENARDDSSADRPRNLPQAAC